MNFDCIVTQVHIPDYDPQGSLTSGQKLNLVNFGLKHLRAFNPNACIILSGHGLRPNANVCDYVYWNDKCEQLNEYGYVAGMPAQFKYVSRGIAKAREFGFKRCLKTRGDCIIGIPNITSHCDNILAGENKQLLITQQTGIETMGDCFMYGDIELMDKIWYEGNPVHDADGLKNTAINYRHAISDFGNWGNAVRRHCAFRDVYKLKFMCLRWNYFNLGQLNDTVKSELLHPLYNFRNYHWGKTNGWHSFDENGHHTGSYWAEQDFYA